MNTSSPSISMSDTRLASVQSKTFKFFFSEMHSTTSLLPESTREGAPASIAVLGFALVAYPIAVERGFISRAKAVRRTLAKLEFLQNGPDGDGPDSISHRGFYYHFLDLQTGRRTWNSEASTIDTAFLIAGALTAAQYFDRDVPEERKIRALADALYRRADWQWAQHGGLTVTHGWRPETGFIKYRWTGYSEALILYILALASPTSPISPASYRAWTKTYRWKTLYGLEQLYAGPLFIHQLSHLWIDFRGIQDEYMRGKAIDYFENSRRATYAQQQYAIRNPRRFKRYGEHMWGLSASDGPGPAVRHLKGKRIALHGYAGRGIPNGPDDGTLSPWAVAGSLPFTPEIVLPSLQYLDEQLPRISGAYGYKSSYNPTIGWISPNHSGICHGVTLAMIENYRTGFLWRQMRNCPAIRKGLRLAGFTGGWL